MARLNSRVRKVNPAVTVFVDRQMSFSRLNPQLRIPNPATFFHANLRGNAFLHAFDVADDADHLAAGVEGIEGVEGDFQGVGVEGAEAFVEEQRVDAGLVADQVGEGEGEGQADQEAFAAG